VLKIVSITPAKNEENYICKCINSLKKQSVSLKAIIVIDDSSEDNTYLKAVECGADKVISLKGSSRRLTGTPHLANVINFGLKYVENNFKELDYILIVGADHILPKNYLEFLTDKMEKNKKIAIASGIIVNERYYEDFPRGSGSLIRYSFWKSLGLRYPLIYGWESYLVYKAKMLGYLTLCYPQLKSYTLRATYKLTNLENIGRSMKSLGYPIEYLLGRFALTFLKNRRGAISMLRGYISMNYTSDVSKFVKSYLRRRIIKRLIRSVKAIRVQKY